MAGYSSTPLWQKLGYKPGLRASTDGAPSNYLKLLALPAGTKIAWQKQIEPGLDFVHVFPKNSVELGRKLTTLRRQIAPNGVVWVSWPKKSSGVTTDITEDTIRDLALPLGFVDVKVCAVDETWSGLKLVIRVSQRGKTS